MVTEKTRLGPLPTAGAGSVPDAQWRRWLWFGLIVVGVLARLWLWWSSIGSNDANNWAYHGINVSFNGLTGAYVKEPALNHPPLLSLYAGAAGLWAHGYLIVFARLIKLPGLLGEAITFIALWRFGRCAGSCRVFALAFGNSGFEIPWQH